MISGDEGIEMLGGDEGIVMLGGDDTGLVEVLLSRCGEVDDILFSKYEEVAEKVLTKGEGELIEEADAGVDDIWYMGDDAGI